jgi:hypothetical protein
MAARVFRQHTGNHSGFLIAALSLGLLYGTVHPEDSPPQALSWGWGLSLVIYFISRGVQFSFKSGFLLFVFWPAAFYDGTEIQRTV